jgi:Skp family chaperone for outer membrane proteins
MNWIACQGLSGWRTLAAVFTVGLGLTLAGCGEDQGGSGGSATPAAAPAATAPTPAPACPHCDTEGATAEADKAKADGNAAEAVPGDAKAHSQYTQELDAALATFQKKVDELAAKTKSAAATGKDKLDAALAKLEQETQEAKAKLAELRAASGEKWQSLKTETASLMSRLHRAYDAAMSEFKSDAPSPQAPEASPTPKVPTTESGNH